MDLIALPALIPDLIIDLRYATPNNIAKKSLYVTPSQCIPKLDKAAANMLTVAADLLRQQSCRLVVWDAYRPQSVQATLLSLEPDSRYVNPKSNHCRGLAVDVTLADMQSNYLDMATDFDDFSPLAHSDVAGLTPAQTRNRAILFSAMSTVGFIQWPYEWWHFDHLLNNK
jgi:D-alanyl-D-alanine dipeptidase